MQACRATALLGLPDRRDIDRRSRPDLWMDLRRGAIEFKANIPIGLADYFTGSGDIR